MNPDNPEPVQGVEPEEEDEDEDKEAASGPVVLGACHRAVVAVVVPLLLTVVPVPRWG